MTQKKEAFEWQDRLEPIMRKAGSILLSYFNNAQQLTHTDKQGNGFVTEADLASERYLIEQLRMLLPEAAITAEESGNAGSGIFRWVIDPLDGTTNFAQGLHYFCISVALTQDDIPQVAAIYQPVLNEFFYAERGKGAWLNGRKIVVSKVHDIQKAMISVCLPYDHAEFDPLLHALDRVAKQAYSIRHFGAAALDLANVACGRMDGIFFAHLGWWDVAAGMLLIEEAGGQISDFTGKALNPRYVSCVAGNPVIYEALLKELKTAGF